MTFEKHFRFDEPYWFNGIYKITQYTWFHGYDCKPYYHAYYLIDKNWGDYVGGKQAQSNKQLTFKECVTLCTKHIKNYTPSNRQIKQAVIAKAKWIN